MLDLLTKNKEFFPEYFKANKLISEYPLKKITDRKKVNIDIAVINKFLNSVASKLPKFKKNIALATILLLSVLLNLTGLFPNTFFHQNEPGLLGPSDQLFKNIIIKLDFDPNIKPDPFKYASILYYNQAFIRGGTLFVIFQTHKLTGFSFGKQGEIFTVSFRDFIEDNGPRYFESYMLWTARLFSAILGTGCVYLTFLISQKLFRNKSIALFSAAALAVMPLHVRNSHYALADIPQTFFFLMSFWASANMYEKKTTKAYLLAGFLVGFSSSLKYFPLSLLPFLIFHTLTGWKNFLSKKFFSSLISMFLGYLTGMPYLFVHFNQIIGFIPYALTWYGPDKLETQSSIFEKVLPKNIHAYHLKFLFKEGLLPPAFIASLAGVFIGLKYFRKAVLFTLIIPVVNGIFIFFYVHQVYEHLSIPMLPFLAMLIGLTVFYLVSFKEYKKMFLVAAVILTLYMPSFFSSAQASIACSTPITEFQSKEWIRKNIPLKSNFAFEPGARLPSELEINWIKSEVNGPFSLAELQEVNAQYLMTMNGYYGVYLSWSQDEFFPKKDILKNQYVQLVVNEYKNSALLTKDFVKPYMCLGNEIYIYRLPPPLPPALNRKKVFNFGNEGGVNSFKLANPGEETYLEQVIGNQNSKALRYSYNQNKFNKFRKDYNFLYVTPAQSDFMDINQNNKYTYEAWVTPEGEDTGINPPDKKFNDFFLRIDFYNDRGGQPIKSSLSPRAKNLGQRQKLSVTSIAPKEAKYAKIGFQGVGGQVFASYLIDDLILFED